MALLALHPFVCSGECEGTLAGMVKRQHAPAGRLVASAAVRPPAGGELRVVQLLVATFTASRCPFVLHRGLARGLTAHMAGRAARGCMLADEDKACPGMIEIHRGPVTGRVTCVAAPVAHFPGESPLMPVLVTALAEAAGKLEDPPSILPLCVTLPARSCQVSSGQRKTRAAVGGNLERGRREARSRVTSFALAIEPCGEIPAVVVCMARGALAVHGRPCHFRAGDNSCFVAFVTGDVRMPSGQFECGQIMIELRTASWRPPICGGMA
jgi:hypothetical protein